MQAGLGTDWSISAAASARIVEAVTQFAADYTVPNFSYYPLISWRDGGWASKAGGPKEELAAQYDLALIRQDDLHKISVIEIPDERFGLIAFSPRQADLASSRRLVDFDGESIVVR